MTHTGLFWQCSIGFITLLACLFSSEQTGAADKPPQTGKAFRKQLELPIGLSWTDVPLRQALTALSDDQQIAIYLDRRVDPGKLVSLAFDGQPLANACRLIAENQKLGVCLVGDVVYFGPTTEVDRLRTSLAMRAKEARRKPAAARGKLLAKKSMRWNELDTPGSVLSQLKKTGGVKIVNADRLPHDLWPAANLPPLAWIDRVGMIAAQFDMTIKFSPDGTAVALMPMPSDMAIDRTAGNLPKVKPPASSGGHQVYALTIKNQPVGKLLPALGRKLEVEVAFDEAAIEKAGISLETLVSFEVKGATLDELLHAATKPAGLSFRRKDKRVTVVPRP